MKRVAGIVMALLAMVAVSLQGVMAEVGQDYAMFIYGSPDMATASYSIPEGPLMVMAGVWDYGDEATASIGLLLLGEDEVEELINAGFKTHTIDEDEHPERSWRDGSRVFNGDMYVDEHPKKGDPLYQVSVIIVQDNQYVYLFVGMTNQSPPYDLVAATLDATFGTFHVPSGVGLEVLLPSLTDMPPGWIDMTDETL